MYVCKPAEYMLTVSCVRVRSTLMQTQSIAYVDIILFNLI